MSVNARFAWLLLLGALAMSGVACGSATLKADGGASGAGGRAGAGGASPGTGGSGGGAPAAPCVLDSTHVDNCILQ